MCRGYLPAETLQRVGGVSRVFRFDPSAHLCEVRGRARDAEKGIDEVHL